VVPSLHSERARDLRRQSPEAERRLWAHLRRRQRLGFKFRRQHPIGCYFADFACLEKGLVVEVDGGQHAETGEYDLERTRAFARLGFKVLRFWNNDVSQALPGVIESIESALVDTSRGLGPHAAIRARRCHFPPRE
jgi:very-short-patch-repair endonuclease